MHFRKNILLGSIAGDVLASTYDLNAIHSKDFNLFPKNSTYTDGTVLTMAVAHALINCAKVATTLSSFRDKYNYIEYEPFLVDHLKQREIEKTYYFGRSVIGRISPIAYVSKNFKDMDELTNIVCEATENDHWSNYASKYIARAVYLCHIGYRKNDVERILHQEFGQFKLTFALKNLKLRFRNPLHSQFIAPLAFLAFFESENYEDAIRNAISIGVNSHTLASVTGAISMAYYGELPQSIVEFTLLKLPPEFIEIMLKFQECFILA